MNLKFWKKEEAPEVQQAPEINEPLGMGMNAAVAGMPHAEPAFMSQSFERPAFSQQSFSQTPHADQHIQLISAKLDTIKAQLETVLQRLDAMERKTAAPETPYQQRWRNV